MNKLNVDFTRKLGSVKPMHGVGQPPFLGIDFSMCDYLKEAHIPYSRLHDVGGWYGGHIYVDTPNLFRDFSADVNNPENYDFAFTDLLITALVERGIEPFFRLGVTIENFAHINAYNIYPPKDYQKWAEICEHVIRHYTEGWANGFQYKITYWEIWNEPDNHEDTMTNHMWRGTAEEYFRLYEVASKYLKKKFPHLKIGGYASCGFYALTNGTSHYAACTPRHEYFLEFFTRFLEYIKAHDCPLDFFSWHSYSDINANLIWADYARKKLDEYGYTATEHTLNEWNCRPDLKGTTEHAALSAGMLIALHATTLDSAMFYDARFGVGPYAGLFDSMNAKPLPTYFSFVAFGELYHRGTQVYTSELPEGAYAMAAMGEDGCLMLVNTNSEPLPLKLEVLGAEKIKNCKIITNDAVWEDTAFENQLPAKSVLLIQF